jgi:hypothetical protein
MESLYFLLSKATQNLSLEQVGILGELRSALMDRRMCTVGRIADLLALDPMLKGARNWLSITQRRQLLLVAESIGSALDANGDLDVASLPGAKWGIGALDPEGVVLSSSGNLPIQESAKVRRLPQLPAREVNNGYEFLAGLSEVVDGLVAASTREVDRIILKDRLSRLPGDRLTLEKIASRLDIRVTRERVRQCEKKLILRLSTALLAGGSSIKLGVCFRPSFVAYWRSGAESFGASRSVAYAEFLEHLASVWGVGRDDLLQHLPILVSVLTSRASLPEQLREQVRERVLWTSRVNEAGMSIDIRNLGMGDCTYDFLDEGIADLGALYQLTKSRRMPRRGTDAGDSIRRSLQVLNECVTSDGSVDWPLYRRSMGFAEIPLLASVDVSEFLESLVASLDAILSASTVSKRAVGIFRTRIAVSKHIRPTLAVTAEMLGGHGPGIKREESILLAFLNAQLVKSDMSCAQVSYPGEFLSHWAHLNKTFQECGSSFDTFRVLLESSWGVALDRYAVAMDCIWAVLSEYPRGRPPRARVRQTSAKAPSPGAESSGVIVLRGFSRAH